MVGMTIQQGGSRRRWRISLLVSLALNLLLIAVIGVWVARPMFRGPPQTPEFGRVVERIAHRVSGSDASALRGAYQSHRDEIVELAGNVRSARERVRAALRADPYDAAVVSAAMADLRTARTTMESAIQGVIQESAAGMSADGRRTLAHGPRVDDRR